MSSQWGYIISSPLTSLGGACWCCSPAFELPGAHVLTALLQFPAALSQLVLWTMDHGGKLCWVHKGKFFLSLVAQRVGGIQGRKGRQRRPCGGWFPQVCFCVAFRPFGQLPVGFAVVSPVALLLTVGTWTNLIKTLSPASGIPLGVYAGLSWRYWEGAFFLRYFWKALGFVKV